MSRKRSSQRKHLKPKAVLRLPDLDQAKSAVLNSLSSDGAQRGYRHAIDELVDVRPLIWISGIFNSARNTGRLSI